MRDNWLKMYARVAPASVFILPLDALDHGFACLNSGIHDIQRCKSSKKGKVQSHVASSFGIFVSNHQFNFRAFSLAESASNFGILSCIEYS